MVGEDDLDLDPTSTVLADQGTPCVEEPGRRDSSGDDELLRVRSQFARYRMDFTTSSLPILCHNCVAPSD